MYEAFVQSLKNRTKDRSTPSEFVLSLSVNYHGVEEEAEFRYNSLKDIPRFLLTIKNGKPHFNPGQKVFVSHPHEDANGLIFQHLHESEDN